jgi:transcription initiation factor TFIID TATA-box-binding protein
MLLFAFRNRIPVIGISDKYVKSGVLLALSFDSEDIGRQAGELANRILSGEDVKKFSLIKPRMVKLSINLNTAEKIGIKITIKPIINIQNIVASGTVGMDLNLNTLAMKLDNTEYEPEQFPGLVYRLTDPKVATLIFRSGKIICVGARSTADAKIALKKTVKNIKKIGIRVNEDNIKVKIENIVVAVNLERDLNLDQLAFQLEDSEYEPEQFPGLVYRIYDPKVAFLLFSSGRVVCAGAKSLDSVKLAVKRLEAKLKSLGS